MFLKPVRLCALLCFFLALQIATAQSFQAIPRADHAAPASTHSATSPTASPTETAKRNNRNGDDSSKTTSSVAPASSTSSSSTSSSTASSNGTTTASTTSSASISNSTSLSNSTFLNVTIPAGQLPIPPAITPGWGVAGTIMMLTGLVYALVGIKNPWIHAFFSTAYMTALGITVLIVYVMTVPLSNALQGGYVAAIILSGCAIGTASMFFKELTEGLGCALGGFCISMWLLCLVPGGLLHTTAAKAIFIACFTLVAFAFYFSRFTRDWSLILLIAFAGSTITVLGIDCFSRAGLKEFWAYIWSLNDNLFPLGANTYPVTRGIRVEIAAIIIVFLIATMSQVRLWKIVREKREQRAAARAEDQRNLQEEEENVGRQIEAANARERAEWERVYGSAAGESITASHLSDSADMKEIGLAISNGYAARNGAGEGDGSECSQSGIDQLMAGEGEDGGVTVRVGADELPEGEMSEGEEGVHEAGNSEKTAGGLETTRADRRASKLSTQSKRVSGTTMASNGAPFHSHGVTPSPQVVPLPFNVPKSHRPPSQRSSVATFADAEEELTSAEPRRTQRNSVVKRFSQGSADLLRSMSQRSARSTQTHNLAHHEGESTEMLVVKSHHRNNDNDNESLAATVDEESVSGSDRGSLDTDDNETREVEPDTKMKDGAAGVEAAERANMKAGKEMKGNAATQDQGRNIRSQVVAGPEEGLSDAPEESVYEPQSEMPKSVGTGSSGPINLTKDRLPRPLSRVALSYRTNEWAKHLSHADLPEVDELPLEKPTHTKKAGKEYAKPVNIEDLQQTAENGAPAPALPRSQSRASMASMTTAQAPLQMAIPEEAAIEHVALVASTISPIDTLAPIKLRSASSTNLRRVSSKVQPIPEEEKVGSPTSDRLPAHLEAEAYLNGETSPVVEPGQFIKHAAVPGVISYSSPQTLLGQREMFLRSRSQGSLMNTISEMQAAPNFSSTGPSESGSLYGYPMYPAPSTPDADDIPLSQRRSMMLNGRMSLNDSSHSLNRSDSRAESATGGADGIAFNSHQPRRSSGLPAQSARETQLANFRMSVLQDLRAGSPMMNSGRETPFASTNNLLGGREAEVQRSIEMQRHVLMGQKEAEAQRREMHRREKDFSDRVFDDRMRSGDLMDAHREAMRKMQRGAR